MKIRTSFVSNSSSSSFIVKDKNKFEPMMFLLKEVQGDYYILNDVMYTSCIADCLDLYNSIYDLADYDISTGWDSPYDEENFYAFEGERGIATVYIEKNKCKNMVEVEQHIKDDLYKYVKDFIHYNTIDDANEINKLTLDEIITFLKSCYEIIS